MSEATIAFKMLQFMKRTGCKFNVEPSGESNSAVIVSFELPRTSRVTDSDEWGDLTEVGTDSGIFDDPGIKSLIKQGFRVEARGEGDFHSYSGGGRGGSDSHKIHPEEFLVKNFKGLEAAESALKDAFAERVRGGR